MRFPPRLASLGTQCGDRSCGALPLRALCPPRQICARPALACGRPEEVEYSLGLIPLGGFVAFPDDDPERRGCGRPAPFAPPPAVARRAAIAPQSQRGPVLIVQLYWFLQTWFHRFQETR